MNTRQQPSAASRCLLYAVLTTVCILVLGWIVINSGDKATSRLFHSTSSDQPATGFQLTRQQLLRSKVVKEVRGKPFLDPHREISKTPGKVIKAGNREDLKAALSEIENRMIQHSVPDSFSMHTIARELKSPDGIAIQPGTGLIYVSEEDPSRITVLEDGIRVVINQRTPIFQLRRGQRVQDTPLTSPEGIAFDKHGALYIAEDRPGGRLLKFQPENGRFPEGEVVQLPGIWDRFAWEDVDVSEKGEILLAGSDMETSIRDNPLGAFTGVILYRDDKGNWWIPHERIFSSFSSVCFSKGAQHAVYTCEALGEVGWVDLGTRQILVGNSDLLAKSPEGICILPNGALMVAQENGVVIYLDPATDEHDIVTTGLGNIESVIWDSGHNRALVTADGTGCVIALHPEGAYSEKDDAMDFAMFYPSHTPRRVPQDCPGYLADLLALGGLDYTEPFVEPKVNFRTFASRVPLVAADLTAECVSGQDDTGDPIEHIQFAVFFPNQVGLDELGVTTMPLATFAARTRSGEVIQTTTMKVESYFTSFGSGEMEEVDLAAIAVPQPGAVSVSSLGITTIQLLGMGKTADYSLVLNPRHPADSYMIVHNPDGSLSHYRLNTPQKGDEDEVWVVALHDKGNELWTLLSGLPGSEDADLDLNIGGPLASESDDTETWLGAL